MAKVMLEMISLGFKCVIVFILYLPTCSTCLYNFFDIFPGNLVICNKAISIDEGYRKIPEIYKKEALHPADL